MKNYLYLKKLNSNFKLKKNTILNQINRESNFFEIFLDTPTLIGH